ncbi:hypothetical protein FACS189487_05170 [Campylobacterota bacterium]|nr:hypothetical protein FACS189487_05170 [Campylobacterota bacterium]
MRAVILLVAVLLSAVFGEVNATIGDANEGERIFHAQLAQMIGQNGADYAKQKTAAEWENAFADNGAEFLATLAKNHPPLKALMQRKSFQTTLPHLRAFFMQYAKDGNGFKHD